MRLLAEPGSATTPTMSVYVEIVQMADCYLRQSRAWAIGIIAGALAVALIAIGIGAAVRLGHTDDQRVCQSGHDELYDDELGYTKFVCDEWVPDVGR